MPPLLATSFHTDPYMWAVVDPDIPRDNPVEDKHRRLVRSHRSSPYDRELKPNTKLRDELSVRFVLVMDRQPLKEWLYYRSFWAMHRVGSSHRRRKILSGNIASTLLVINAGLPSLSNR